MSSNPTAAIAAAPDRPAKSQTLYLPGLNGLRAIAALAVVVSHIAQALVEFGLNSNIFGNPGGAEGERGLLLAGHGVTIFFVLSGFLITFLLLKEKEISPLKVKEFYIRRILRIWPLYYLYFLAVIATLFIFDIPFPGSSVPFYIFLAANIPFILEASIPLLHHYWSLGVEEQFYLFFPQLARFTNRVLLRVVIVLVGLLLLLKFVFWVMFNKYGITVPFMAISVTRFHMMLMGVAAAILYYQHHRAFVAVTTHTITQIIAWGSIVLLAVNKFHLASVIDGELVAVVSVCLIMGQISKRSFVNLENKVCDFLGKISYGIYVIHPLLIFYFYTLFGKFRKDTTLNYILVFALVIGATIFIAWLSYTFYEKKFLKLKAKYSTVKSSGSRSERNGH